MFVRGSPMVPLVGNICTMCTNLTADGTIGKETGANCKHGNTIGNNGTNVTNNGTIRKYAILYNTPHLVWSFLEKVPQDLFHSVYFEYEENCTHDRLLSLNYAFCHIKR